MLSESQELAKIKNAFFVYISHKLLEPDYCQTGKIMSLLKYNLYHSMK